MKRTLRTLSIRSVAPRTVRDQAEVDTPVVRRLGALDLSGPSGVVYGVESTELNANLVVLSAGDSIDHHRNDEVDVLMVVLTGSAELHLDGTAHALEPDMVVLIPRRATRGINALTRTTYYSVHRRL